MQNFNTFVKENVKIKDFPLLSLEQGYTIVYIQQNRPFSEENRRYFWRLPSIWRYLLDFVNDSLESLWVIHTEVSEDLAVDVDAIGMEQTHELRVAETLKTGSSIDTLNPKCAEVALLGATIAECISQTFLPGILSNGPHILAGTNVTSGEVENLLASFT